MAPRWVLHRGDCIEALRDMPDSSVDSVVTDPPYGLSDHKPADIAEARIQHALDTAAQDLFFGIHQAT